MKRWNICDLCQGGAFCEGLRTNANKLQYHMLRALTAAQVIAKGKKRECILIEVIQGLFHETDFCTWSRSFPSGAGLYKKTKQNKNKDKQKQTNKKQYA